jgi:hypothetical protein
LLILPPYNGKLLILLKVYSIYQGFTIDSLMIKTMDDSNPNHEPTPISDIASQFGIPSPIELVDFQRKGNINQQTYWIKAGSPANRSEYLLQLLNPSVFTQPQRVMDAMISCIHAQEIALAKDASLHRGEWEILHLIPTKSKKPYLEIADPDGVKCWRMMVYIKDTHSFKSLREIPDKGTRLFIGEEAGRGLAIFGALTAQMNPSHICCPLPGYRDTELYYDQFHSVLEEHRTLEEASDYLPEDADLRYSTAPCFYTHLNPEEYHRRLSDPQLSRWINLALEQKSYALTLAHGLKTGKLKQTAIHGDTKLENFLFSDTTKRVKALVDLDTIMPHTWLSDWGDMIRSLTNIAGERETNPDSIQIDLEVFQAAAKGYLSGAHADMLQEVELMAEAPAIMALELGVRFLTDYLRGDNYFAVNLQDPPDLNKIRAMVQLNVFEKLRRNTGLMKQHIARLCREIS